MKQYQKEVSQLIDKLISDILAGKLVSKRDINNAIKNFAKEIKIPMDKLVLRLREEMYYEAQGASKAVTKALMTVNQANVIQSMSPKDISILVDRLFSTEIIFEELSGDKLIKKAVSIIDNLNNVNNVTVKDVKAKILGGYISGASPAEIASSLIGNKRAKKERNYLKTISFTVIHKANELANLETFIANEKFIKWILYKTVGDERVDDVCFRAEMESIQLKLKPREYKRQHMLVPSAHWGCRCSLQAMTSDEDNIADAILSAKKRKYGIKYVDGVKEGNRCVPPKWLKSSMTISNIKKIKGKCRYSYKEYLGESSD